MVRTLLLGLEGATFHILTDLVKDDSPIGPVMPCLRQLLAAGHSALLRSHPHPQSITTWATALTGQNPGRHGIFDLVQCQDDGRAVRYVLNNAFDIKAKGLWHWIDRGGGRTALLNFPLTVPPPALHGFVVPGHTPWKQLPANCHPAGLFASLQQALGISVREISWDYGRESEIGGEMSEGYLLNWILQLRPREEQWFQIARHLLRHEDLDFMGLLFDGLDKLQHQAWRYLDPRLAPAEPDAGFRAVRQHCLSFYRTLDEHIAELIALAGPQAQIFIVSNHGFSGSTRTLHLNRYLADLGHLTYRAERDDELRQQPRYRPVANLDWSQTVAYCPTPHSNAIIIRCARGRGQTGIPPTQYEAFRQRLGEQLLGLTDETGAPLVQTLWFREELYHGPALEQAPDITLSLRDHGFASISNSRPLLERRKAPLGCHHPDGVFIAYGPTIQPGRSAAIELADLMPTLLHSLNLPIPDGLDGRCHYPCFSA